MWVISGGIVVAALGVVGPDPLPSEAGGGGGGVAAGPSWGGGFAPPAPRWVASTSSFEIIVP